MALVIYIDVLLVVNLYINYFLVRGTSLMLRRKVSPRRVILASAVGAVGSLLILVPDLNPILCVLIKIALGIGITFAAFGRQNKIDFLISSLSFLVVSFIFGGAMTALWNIAAPAGIFVRNGTPYCRCTVYSRYVWRIPRIQNDNRPKKTAEPRGRQNPKRRRRSYAGRPCGHWKFTPGQLHRKTCFDHVNRQGG